MYKRQTIASVLVFNFLFTAPRFTLRAYDRSYPFTFAVMFLAALITGSLASRLKQHAGQAARDAYRLKVLLDTNPVSYTHLKRLSKRAAFLKLLDKFKEGLRIFYGDQFTFDAADCRVVFNDIYRCV